MKNLFREQKYRNAGMAAGAFVLLAFFLLIINPKQSPLIILLIPFVVLFVILYNTILFLLRLLDRGQKTVRHERSIAVILGLEPVLLLLLASINQLTVRDGILSLVLICGLAWYLSRSARQA